MVFKLDENIFDDKECTIKDTTRDLPVVIPYEEMTRIMMIQDFKTNQIFIQIKTKDGETLFVPVSENDKDAASEICRFVQTKINGETYTPPIKEAENQTKKDTLFKHKFSWSLLISFGLGLAYLLWSAYYWGTALAEISNAGNSASEIGNALGGALALRMVYPSLIALFIAVILNFLGMLFRSKWLALAASICYLITLFLFPMYWMFTIAETILCLVAFILYIKNIR